MHELEVERYLINKNTQEFFKLENEMTFGRKSTSDVVVKDDLVSSKHFKIRKDKGRVFVTDLGSYNHTYLNNTLIEENKETELELGDEIKVGNHTFILSDIPDLDEQTAHAAEMKIQTLSETIDEELAGDISHPELKLRTEQLQTQKVKVDGIISRIKTLEGMIEKSVNCQKEIQDIDKQKFELNKSIDLSKIGELKAMKDEYLSLKEKYDKIAERLGALEGQIGHYIIFDQIDKKSKDLTQALSNMAPVNEMEHEIARLQFELGNEQSLFKNLHINYERTKREVERELKEERKHEVKRREIEDRIKQLEDELKKIK
jgi:pSer/pThr/pTyr-binding forkhead associated (FHA) protein